MGRYLDLARAANEVTKKADSKGFDTKPNGLLTTVQSEETLSRAATTKETKLTKEVTATADATDLDASRRRLEAAGICIAIWDDGSMRVLVSEGDTRAAVDDGGTIYSPKEMMSYVTFAEEDRRRMHSFKKKTGEWKA